jgi:hypothetical protein
MRVDNRGIPLSVPGWSEESLSFLKCPNPTVGPIQSSILRKQEIPFSGVKRSQRESDHLPQSLVEMFFIPPRTLWRRN